MFELSKKNSGGKSGLNFNFDQYLDERRQWLEESLDIFLCADDKAPQTLWQSMRYSVLLGGKRLRAVLAFAGAESVLFSGNFDSQLAGIDNKEACQLVMPPGLRHRNGACHESHP